MGNLRRCTLNLLIVIVLDLNQGHWCLYSVTTQNNATTGSSDGVQTISTSPGFCPDDWYTFAAGFWTGNVPRNSNKCYKIYGPPGNSWTQAHWQCRSIDSNLVSIHSPEEQNFLTTLMVEIQSKIFIGLRTAPYSRVFRWSDNSPLDFTGWYPGEPNNYHNKEDCVGMLYYHTHIGMWNDVPCNNIAPYVCQKPRNPNQRTPGRDPAVCSEPDGWLRMGTSCYKIRHEREDQSSWQQAESFCNNYGGNLASVKSVLDTVRFRMRMTQTGGPFWIGINSTKTGKYTWLGKNPLIYTNWQNDQPKHVSEQSNCVAIDNEAKWMVKNCEETLSFICEVNKAPEPETPTIAPYHPNMTCPESSPNWHDFGGDCCYIIDTRNYNYDNASARCADEGGFLASFHSTVELEVIKHHIRHQMDPLFIGLRRNDTGHFVWSDGSAMDFDNWERGEPNSINEMCVHMYATNGKWNDVPCDRKYGYVCSTSKVPVTYEISSLSASEKLSGAEQLGTGSIITIVVGVLLVLSATAIILYYFGPPLLKTKITDAIPLM